jgi:rhodanese-related sulfurtransferase
VAWIWASAAKPIPGAGLLVDRDHASVWVLVRATCHGGLLDDAQTRTRNSSLQEVARELAGGDAVLIDLCESEERAQSGTIPGAVHAPRGIFEFYADTATAYHRPEFDRNRRLILNCASGGRSALVPDTLRDTGYGHVAHLGSGINAWKETGHAVDESGDR